MYSMSFSGVNFLRTSWRTLFLPSSHWSDSTPKIALDSKVRILAKNSATDLEQMWLTIFSKSCGLSL